MLWLPNLRPVRLLREKLTQPLLPKKLLLLKELRERERRPKDSQMTSDLNSFTKSQMHSTLRKTLLKRSRTLSITLRMRLPSLLSKTTKSKVILRPQRMIKNHHPTIWPEPERSSKKLEPS